MSDNGTVSCLLAVVVTRKARDVDRQVTLIWLRARVNAFWRLASLENGRALRTSVCVPCLLPNGLGSCESESDIFSKIIMEQRKLFLQPTHQKIKNFILF